MAHDSGTPIPYRTPGVLWPSLRIAAHAPAPVRRAGVAPEPGRAYSCYISHGQRDWRFGEKLLSDLQRYGIRTWSCQSAAARSLALAAPRQLYDRVIVVCSWPSLTSTSVMDDIEDALQKEQELRRQVLYPLRLDNYMLHDWPYARREQVAAKVVADFRGWNLSVARYEFGLKKLLDALRAGS